MGCLLTIQSLPPSGASVVQRESVDPPVPDAPVPGICHQVQAGETLWSISERYGVSLEAICSQNQKQNTRIFVGESLWIPGVAHRSEPVSRGRSARFLWPLSGEISSPFGYRWGRLHAGIDIAAEEGTFIQAAQDGKVRFVGWLGGYGYALIVDHGEGFSTLYGHLSAAYVKSGAWISIGQVIAAVGTTGDSTGPHLHFEIRYRDQPLNPLPLLPRS